MCACVEDECRECERAKRSEEEARVIQMQLFSANRRDIRVRRSESESNLSDAVTCLRRMRKKRAEARGDARSAAEEQQ